jgi:hypothetical protein
MSIATAHWSATAPGTFLGDYHVEFYFDPADAERLSAAYRMQAYEHEPLTAKAIADCKSVLALKKTTPLHQPTTYGTFHMNHDPSGDGDGPDIEVGALCMGGEHVETTGPWGNFPYTPAHFIIHAALMARVCKIMQFDPSDYFDTGVSPHTLQHGPIFRVSTHAERAFQTINVPTPPDPSLGYFIFSGDPDCRWDIAVFEESHAATALASSSSAVSAALQTASNLRSLTMSAMDLIDDLWGLDG